jgi:hypothetical protein
VYLCLSSAQIANPFLLNVLHRCVEKTVATGGGAKHRNKTVSLSLAMLVFSLMWGWFAPLPTSVRVGCLLQPTVLLMTHPFSLILLSLASCQDLLLLLAIQVGFFTSDGHEKRSNRDETKIETRDTSEEYARKRVVQRHLAGTRTRTLFWQPDDLCLFLKKVALESEPHRGDIKWLIDGDVDIMSDLHCHALYFTAVADAILPAAGALTS